jgi:hypothetical protein
VQHSLHIPFDASIKWACKDIDLVLKKRLRMSFESYHWDADPDYSKKFGRPQNMETEQSWWTVNRILIAIETHLPGQGDW